MERRPERATCGPRSGGAGARAGPPDPRPRGHPRPPKPSRPRSLPQPGALSTALVAGFGTQTTRAENGHPPRSMAATLRAARAAPPPRRPSAAQAPRHNGWFGGGGTMGRASVPAHHLCSGSAPPASGLPPLRAHAQSSPTVRGAQAARPTAPPTSPRSPTSQQASTYISLTSSVPRPAPKRRSRPFPVLAQLSHASLQPPASPVF